VSLCYSWYHCFPLLLGPAARRACCHLLWLTAVVPRPVVGPTRCGGCSPLLRVKETSELPRGEWRFLFSLVLVVGTRSGCAGSRSGRRTADGGPRARPSLPTQGDATRATRRGAVSKAGLVGRRDARSLCAPPASGRVRCVPRLPPASPPHLQRSPMPSRCRGWRCCFGVRPYGRSCALGGRPPASATTWSSATVAEAGRAAGVGRGPPHPCVARKEIRGIGRAWRNAVGGGSPGLSPPTTTAAAAAARRAHTALRR